MRNNNNNNNDNTHCTHLHSDAPRKHVRDEELGAETHVGVDIWFMVEDSI